MIGQGIFTFREYLLLLPSGSITDTLAVLVQADTQQLSAETAVVPFGMTGRSSELDDLDLCAVLPRTTAMFKGKLPLTLACQSSQSDIVLSICESEKPRRTGREVLKQSRPDVQTDNLKYV